MVFSLYRGLQLKFLPGGYIWSKKKVRPEVAAAIASALVEGGQINAGNRVAGIDHKKQDSLWRQVGLVELMNSRKMRNRFGI